MNRERLAVILTAALFGPTAAILLIVILIVWAAINGELEIY